jgi:phosphoglycolate phosphatase
LGISGYFEQTPGFDNIQAYSKEGIAKEWMEANPSARVLLIGDTDHDCEVAGSTGMDCMLVATGHQSLERLSECGVPVYGGVKNCWDASSREIRRINKLFC